MNHSTFLKLTDKANVRNSVTHFDIQKYLLNSERECVWSQKITELLPKESSLNILDLGAGSGAWSKYWKNVFPLANVVAVDRNEIEFKDGIETQIIDVRDFKFGENDYNFVFASSIFHFLSTSEVKELLSKIYNSLKPDGVLAVKSITPWNHAFLQIDEQDSIDFDRAKKEKLNSETYFDAYSYSTKSNMSFWNKFAFTKLCESFGFKRIYLNDFPNNGPFAHDKENIFPGLFLAILQK